MQVPAILEALAARRPVFHSEADLQFAFAWAAKELDPELEVRLETHPEPWVRLDLQISHPADRTHVAIELKYLTRLWTGEVAGEVYALKNHGAQDVRCYDVVKDIERVERFVEGKPGWTGHVVVLANDASYWCKPGHTRLTNAGASRIYDGAALSDIRSWGPLTGAGTSKGRENPVNLRRGYHLRWSDYSMLPGTGGQFRTLVIPIDLRPREGQ